MDDWKPSATANETYSILRIFFVDILLISGARKQYYSGYHHYHNAS